MASGSTRHARSRLEGISTRRVGCSGVRTAVPRSLQPCAPQNPSAGEYVETRGYCPADDRCKMVPCYTSFDPRGRKRRNMIDHGGLTMRKRSLLFIALLVPAFLVLGGFAVVQAQQKTSSTAGAKRWSDASTWPDNKVPAKDAVV